MAFDNLKLDKGMYGESGKSFSQVLERLDPSENYRGTAYEHLDAFQRQLKRFDIRVKGPNSDCVDKFFSTVESRVLFPEYIHRMIHQGMEGEDHLGDIVSTVTNINSYDYRSMFSIPTEEMRSLAEVAEGASIPETNIYARENYVTLRKRGRILSASYEAIRFQRLDLFSVMLRQIGAHMQTQLMDEAVKCLLEGDGLDNENIAPVYSPGDATIGGTEGVLDYEALVKFWSLFHPYEMNTLIAAPDMMVKLLNMEEMKNPLAGFDFQRKGNVISPLGAKLIRNDSLEAGTLIGLDRRYALEMVKAGDVEVEYDKLIDRQIERAAITCMVGFVKIQTEAVKALKL